MSNSAIATVRVTILALWLSASLASAEQYLLLTGVDAGKSPGTGRTVFPSGPPSIAPGTFSDGDRLAGTSDAGPELYLGTGTPLVSPNQYGALSFKFRRGSIPLGAAGQQPILAVDYLGGPLLDLDGDLFNGSRRLTPMIGQTPVEIPGTAGNLKLTPNPAGGTIGLANFDATSTNSGFPGFGPGIAVTVNTLAGTQPNGALGSAINPVVDTRQGSMSLHAPHVWRIEDFGYEFWQDSIDPNASTASSLGTFQYLGSLRGWLIERDGTGSFPSLAGLGLGSTQWPLVDVSSVGSSYVQSGGVPPMATITDGPAGDLFSAPNNGGLAMTDFGGDLGSYLDNVVLPLVDPLSQRVVYLESAGFGMNNSFDPVFGDTTGYDVVLIAQSAPIPEPATFLMVMASLLAARRRARKANGR